MIRALFSFCILFMIMWGGWFAYTLYRPINNYYNKNPQLVIQISDLSKTLAEDEVSYINEKSKKREYELALEYDLSTTIKISALTQFCNWMFIHALPNIPNYINPWGKDNLINDVKAQKGLFDKVCKDADSKKKVLNEKLKECKQKIAELEVKKQKNEAIFKEKKESLQKLQNCIKETALEYLTNGWKEPLATSIVLSICVIMYRFVAYFVLSPVLINFMKDVELPPSDRNTKSAPSNTDTEGLKIVHCELPMNEIITVKDESYCGGYTDFAAAPKLEKRTCFIYSTRYWFMSIMCGLTIMTRFSNKNASTQHIRITSDDPDEYFCKLELRQGEPLFVTPRNLVAFSKGVQIKSINHFLNLSAWAMGQLRYYVLEGEGYVVLKSNGGMSCIQSDCSQLNVHKKHSIINACGRLLLKAHRTETLVPYLLGNSSLFDVMVHGEGSYHIRNTSRKALTTTEKFTSIFFSSLGKVLGF